MRERKSLEFLFLKMNSVSRTPIHLELHLELHPELPRIKNPNNSKYRTIGIQFIQDFNAST